MAPSLLVWIYTGGEDGSPEAARRGEQLAYAGDDVMDDVLGKGIINSVDRGDVVVAPQRQVEAQAGTRP